ncbi:unnamed protein product [Urochloa decumbens]|uniref:Transmembrane protein n=1 Tax=Urochloa decumbens TaxID=240449 RepID=A0ABC8ZGJ9_9POAL
MAPAHDDGSMEEGSHTVALGYPLILGAGGGRQAPLGCPPVDEPPPQQAPRRFEDSSPGSRSTCCMFVTAFSITIGFVLLTELFLSMAVQTTPNPITVLVFLPVVAVVFTAAAAGCFLLTLLY